jgi:hypothetical protein
MIFSMTTAIQPEENVSEAYVAPINQLISEVKSQKEKIAELGNIISSQFLNPKTRSMGPQPASPTSHAGTDLWELAEMEEEERSLAMQPQVCLSRTSTFMDWAQAFLHQRLR